MYVTKMFTAFFSPFFNIKTLTILKYVVYVQDSFVDFRGQNRGPFGIFGVKIEGSTERCTVTTRNLISEVQNFQHYICFKDKCRILCTQGCNYCRLVASDSSITKTCPRNIQRFFSAVKIENFIGKFLIFFLFLLKT